MKFIFEADSDAMAGEFVVLNGEVIESK